MLAVGIDSCAVKRFASWVNYSKKKLQRVYSQQEIAYCLKNKNLATQRLAVRFALRESLFKALAHIDEQHKVPFLTLCKAVTIFNNGCAPKVSVNWEMLQIYISTKKQYPHVLCSFTHTDDIATVVVILQ